MRDGSVAGDADILYKRYIRLGTQDGAELDMQVTSKQLPLYQQIYDEIKGKIEDGTFQPKDRIPSEPELAEEFEVSRITVRRAVEELCARGYLVKQQGRGTFVSAPHMSRRLLQTTAAEPFSKLCERMGLEAGARVLACQIVPARPEEIEFLGLSEGALLLYIQRVRSASDQPIFEENIFLPYIGYERMMQMDLNNVSIFDTIAEVGGRRPVQTLRRSIEAVRATSEQASRLAITANDPLLYLHVFFADADGVPVCIGRQYYVGSRYRFEQ